MQEKDNGVLLAQQCELEGFLFSRLRHAAQRLWLKGRRISQDTPQCAAGSFIHACGLVNVLLMIDAVQQPGEKNE
jgi:hypothetical protein